MLDIVFPPRCPICMDILWEKGVKICSNCADKVTFIREPLCKKCGKQLNEDEEEYCRDCDTNEHLFTQGRAVFQYKKEIKNSIYNFKYNNKREFADYYVECIKAECGEWIRKNSPDALIPIPLHPRKQRARGYNQAEILANLLGEEYCIPVINNLLIRSKNTTPQKELSNNSRKKNMKKAFKMSENIVELSTVMVIDDIYTTGATMDAAAEVLLEAGVKDIFCLSLCIGDGF